MRHRRGMIFIVSGTVLLLGALSLLLYNQKTAAQAQTTVNAVLPRLIEKIHGEPLNPVETMAEPTAPEAKPEGWQPVPEEMDTVELEGHSYIGYVSIPSLQLTLPVMADWSYPKLKIAPCRYCGSVCTRDLVLMAHNYEKHFGDLSRLRGGEAVTFTDVHGVTTAYIVAFVDILEPTDVEKMKSGEYELTLFTCTYGGKTRVTVHCKQIG